MSSWLGARDEAFFAHALKVDLADVDGPFIRRLGWIPAVVLFFAVSTECLMWLAAGGVSYTVGTLFLIFDERVRYFHAVWHLFVIVASACHYYAIVALIILPSAN